MGEPLLLKGGRVGINPNKVAVFLATFSAGKSQRKKKICYETSTEQKEKAETGDKKDIQGRTNNIRKRRHGWGGGGTVW